MTEASGGNHDAPTNGVQRDWKQDWVARACSECGHDAFTVPVAPAALLDAAIRERDEARAALDDASRRIDSLRVEREVFFCQRCEAVGEELTCSCDDREHWVTLTVTSVGNLDRAIRERDEARALAEKQSDLLTRLAAERDRARADLNDLNDQYQELRIEADETRAEVERLREVLRQIANGRLDGAQVSTTEEWADAAMSLAGTAYRASVSTPKRGSDPAP